jgi:hypothetical protein
MKAFNWIKLGLITNALPKTSWSDSYLQFPAAIVLDDRIRVFITTRPEPESDGKNVTYIRFFDLNRSDLLEVIGFSDYPVIPLGGPGEFDQFGTMPGDLVKVGNKIFMYYTGWNRLQGVPYNFSVGLATSDDNCMTFVKYSKGPIIGQSVINPFTCGSGATIEDEGTIHMFAISGLEWKLINGKIEHTYGIRHATSTNGLDWDFEESFAIFPKDEYEAIAAPTVIKIDGKYHMWFSYRGSFDFRNGKDSYRIGYAFSEDLYNWTRNDELSGIDVSINGWDSKMVCYPYVFHLENKVYMLYNGNTFGKDSIGLAELNIVK